MTQLTVTVEQTIAAPATLVYRLIADYQTHHEHILPDAIQNLQVEAGGVGAGTIIRFETVFAGQRRPLRATIAEPVPGRVLTERSLDTPLLTTWTVTPVEQQCRVQIATVWTAAPGVAGLVERLSAPALLRRAYREELSRLEQYAQRQAAAG